MKTYRDFTDDNKRTKPLYKEIEHDHATKIRQRFCQRCQYENRETELQNMQLPDSKMCDDGQGGTVSKNFQRCIVHRGKYDDVIHYQVEWK